MLINICLQFEMQVQLGKNAEKMNTTFKTVALVAKSKQLNEFSCLQSVHFSLCPTYTHTHAH